MAIKKILDAEVYAGIRCVEYRQNGHLIAWWYKTETGETKGDIIQFPGDLTIMGEADILPKIVIEFPETVEFSTEKPFEPITYIAFAESITIVGADSTVLAKEVIQQPGDFEFYTKASTLIQYILEFSSSFNIETAYLIGLTKYVNQFSAGFTISITEPGEVLQIDDINRISSSFIFSVKAPVLSDKDTPPEQQETEKVPYQSKENVMSIGI